MPCAHKLLWGVVLYIRNIIIQCFCEQVPETGEVGDHEQRELLYFCEQVPETGAVGDHEQRELYFCEQVSETGEVGDCGRDHLKQRELLLLLSSCCISVNRCRRQVRWVTVNGIT